MGRTEVPAEDPEFFELGAAGEADLGNIACCEPDMEFVELAGSRSGSEIAVDAGSLMPGFVILEGPGQLRMPNRLE